MSQNAQIPMPASKTDKTTKKLFKNYPIAEISRHKKTSIRELAYSACFVLAGEDEISSASMSDLLIRCLLRFPSLMISAATFCTENINSIETW